MMVDINKTTEELNRSALDVLFVVMELSVVLDGLHQLVDFIFQLSIGHDALKKTRTSDVSENVLDARDTLCLEVGQENLG